MPRVLIVDDERAVRESLALLFEVSGWDVLQAEGGGEALQCLDDESVDLLITDIGMPEMDGWTLAEVVRTREPAMPVIYATGWSRVAARPVPGGVVVEKPLEAAELLGLADRLTSPGQISVFVGSRGYPIAPRQFLQG